MLGPVHPEQTHAAFARLHFGGSRLCHRHSRALWNIAVQEAKGNNKTVNRRPAHDNMSIYILVAAGAAGAGAAAVVVQDV